MTTAPAWLPHSAKLHDDTRRWRRRYRRARFTTRVRTLFTRFVDLFGGVQ